MRKSPPLTLALVTATVNALSSEGIAFCHWKSNVALDRALSGDTDIDLLVARNDATRFLAVVTSLGFHPAHEPGSVDVGTVVHLYQVDRDTGTLVHLHVYYQLLTGGALVKNHRLPLAASLLGSRTDRDGMPVPSVEAEFALFVLRKSMECVSFWEHLLLRRERREVSAECRWFSDRGGEDLVERSWEFLSGTGVAVGGGAYRRAAGALLRSGIGLTTWWRCRGVARALRSYRIRSPASTAWLRPWRLFRMALRKATGGKRGRRLEGGGGVIAFVGPEATGKSTLNRELRDWLGRELRVGYAHCGLPPSSPATILPNLVVPILRFLAPRFRTTRVESEGSGGDSQDEGPGGIKLWVFALRSWMIAHDRHRLLHRLSARAAKGELVICDRYPTSVPGAMDSVQIDPRWKGVSGSRVLRWIAGREMACYRRCPPPDVVLRLKVSVDVALERNVRRRKKGKEGEDYVRRRHALAEKGRFASSRVVDLDTDGRLDETIARMKLLVWEAL